MLGSAAFVAFSLLGFAGAPAPRRVAEPSVVLRSAYPLVLGLGGWSLGALSSLTGSRRPA